MKRDVLDLIIGPDEFRDSHGLAAPDYVQWQVLSEPDANGLQTLVYCKGNKGYPGDWLTVAEGGIYQRLTEDDWSQPSTGKLRFGIGGKRFPRFIDPGDSQVPGAWSFSLDRPDTDYVIFGPGTPYGLPGSRNTNDGEICTFSGPYHGLATGDLPVGTDWTLDFERNIKNGVKGWMERVTHREGYGRYQWQQFRWDKTANVYVPDVKPNGQPLLTLLNKIVAGTPPVPVQRIF